MGLKIIFGISKKNIQIFPTTLPLLNDNQLYMIYLFSLEKYVKSTK
jgi:hypothetical protein